MNIKLLQSTVTDPWYNLSLEEKMLDEMTADQVIFFLWQNAHTVVIGRNQNAWKECRWRELEQTGGKLARRSSGGGAVYHDLGNLNFTFLAGRDHYDLERQLSVILNALRGLGIQAVFGGRNDLVADERKFSGNAFVHKSHASCHHGTLLVDVQMDRLSRYLRVSREKIAAKGVDSVRSRVVNLNELAPDLTIDRLKDALFQEFSWTYNADGTIEMVNPESHPTGDRYTRYASWEWRFGATPDFDLDLETRFPWGGVELALNLNRGVIRSVRMFTDAMDTELAGTVEQALTGVPLDHDRVRQALSVSAGPLSDQVADIRDWLDTRDF